MFSHTFCLLICRLNANNTEWICMQISRNIVNGPESNDLVSVGIWVIVWVQKPSHHFLQTFRLLGSACSCFSCYISLDLLRYFRRSTGRQVGTRREFAANAMLAVGLSGFNAHRRGNSLPWNITTTNDDKGGNPATTTVVRRTVM